MKKLLLGGLSCLCALNVFAGSYSFNIPLSIPINSSCRITFNVTNLDLQLIEGYTSNAMTNVTIFCTNGTSVAMNITSQNNWHLRGDKTAKLIAYVLTYAGGGQTLGAQVNHVWSNGVANQVIMTGTATTMPWVIPLSVETEKINYALPHDSYNDQITLSIDF